MKNDELVESWLRFPEIIDESDKSQGVWNIGNKLLYDLCQSNFEHAETDKILAKIWLIGRTYSADIDRIKNRIEKSSDKYFINYVAPAFKKMEIDQKLANLRRYNGIEYDNLEEILELHNYLTLKIAEINSQHDARKNIMFRSFSSKYLHFHLPDLYFIYDSRAEASIRNFLRKPHPALNQITNSGSGEKLYSDFFLKCYEIQRFVVDHHKIKLTPRQIDNILVQIANEAILN